MGHMRISGNEPRQWSFAKQSGFKIWENNCPKVPKQAEAKRDGVII